MTVEKYVQSFADWSDLISLSLLFLAILSNGLDPTYPLWGFPLQQHAERLLSMTTLIVFSAFRYVIEGIHSTTAPREFLTISVLYAARWMYLYYTLHWSSNIPCRLARAASAVSRLSTLRAGRSTHPDRTGQKEVVIRKGTKQASGQTYWRGVIDKIQQVGDACIVYLLDESMHMDLLSPIATTTYAREQNNSLDDFYKRIYECVMTVEGADEAHVDWSDFLNNYPAITKTNFAMRVGATADSELGGVARRIAADACNYVSGRGDFRTETQIHTMNLCIEKAAEELVQDMANE